MKQEGLGINRQCHACRRCEQKGTNEKEGEKTYKCRGRSLLNHILKMFHNPLKRNVQKLGSHLTVNNTTSRIYVYVGYQVKFAICYENQL
jgi:hypothetical protein